MPSGPRSGISTAVASVSSSGAGQGAAPSNGRRVAASFTPVPVSEACGRMAVIGTPGRSSPSSSAADSRASVPEGQRIASATPTAAEIRQQAVGDVAAVSLQRPRPLPGCDAHQLGVQPACLIKAFLTDRGRSAGGHADRFWHRPRPAEVLVPAVRLMNRQPAVALCQHRRDEIVVHSVWAVISGDIGECRRRHRLSWPRSICRILSIANSIQYRSIFPLRNGLASLHGAPLQGHQTRDIKPATLIQRPQ